MYIYYKIQTILPVVAINNTKVSVTLSYVHILQDTDNTTGSSN